jgi:hypothetical protein
MANSTRSRRGTSPSFWRNYNEQQLMMAQACMPSVRPFDIPKVDRIQATESVVPTPVESRKVFIVNL